MVLLVLVLGQTWANYKTANYIFFSHIRCVKFWNPMWPTSQKFAPAGLDGQIVRLNVCLKKNFNHLLTKRAQNGMI